MYRWLYNISFISEERVWGKLLKVEKFPTIVGWENWYCKNNYSTKRHLQIRCNPNVNPHNILHRKKKNQNKSPIFPSFSFSLSQSLTWPQGVCEEEIISTLYITIVWSTIEISKTQNWESTQERRQHLECSES